MDRSTQQKQLRAAGEPSTLRARWVACPCALRFVMEYGVLRSSGWIVKTGQEARDTQVRAMPPSASPNAPREPVLTTTNSGQRILGPIERCKGGWIDGRTDGQTDRQT